MVKFRKRVPNRWAVLCFSTTSSKFCSRRRIPWQGTKY